MEVAGGNYANIDYEDQAEFPLVINNTKQTPHTYRWYFCAFFTNILMVNSFGCFIWLVFYIFAYHHSIAYRPQGSVITGYVISLGIMATIGATFITTLCINCCTKCFGMCPKKQ